jgi:phosphoglycolate phosphatase
MTLICFDLEGTLVDPFEGVQASLRSTCEHFGLPCPDRDRIAGAIGRDMTTFFEALPGPGAQEAAEHYWRLFSEEGVFDQRVLDGVHLMLARLKRQGHRLVLAACQPSVLAQRTLHQFDLLLGFDEVAALTTGESWKSKVEILDQLREDGAFQSGGYLIGDQADDMRAATVHGLRAIGVAYGFGSRQELLEAKTEIILDSVQALDGWLEKELSGPEIYDPFSRSE